MVVRVKFESDGMRFPSYSFVVLTVDQFVGCGGDCERERGGRGGERGGERGRENNLNGINIILANTLADSHCVLISSLCHKFSLLISSLYLQSKVSEGCSVYPRGFEANLPQEATLVVESS